MVAPGPAGLEAYCPHLRYVLLAENAYQEAELASLRNLAAALFRLENSRTPTDLRKVLEFMGYTVADDEFTLLWKLVGGSPGYAEALLENANEIASSQGVKRGIEALEAALRYFPTLKTAA